MTIADALARYYVEQGLPADGGESERWFHIHVGRFTIPAPNPPARRKAVFYHDVNHILTGYDNVFSRGEMVIAGYEIGNGCGPYWIAWLINLGMFLLGLLLHPRLTFQAFVRGRRASSLYRRSDRAAIRAMTVEELRAALGVREAAPQATLADSVSFVGWSVTAAALALGPPVLALAAIV
jgi:hypothetical protein